MCLIKPILKIFRPPAVFQERKIGKRGGFSWFFRDGQLVRNFSVYFFPAKFFFCIWEFWREKIYLQRRLLVLSTYKFKFYDLLDSPYLISLYHLEQGRPTQIYFWAVFRKFSKNIDFLDKILTKTVKKHSKYRKITEFQFKIDLESQKATIKLIRNLEKFKPNKKFWSRPGDYLILFVIQSVSKIGQLHVFPCNCQSLIKKSRNSKQSFDSTSEKFLP
jgi:hypothetical protein